MVADLSTEHRDDEDVDYEQVPPLGGPHDPDWLACGAYDEPLRDENAVHDLEHGTVWITYDPDLDEEEVDALEELLPDDGIMSPYPGLPAPVVVTVWGVQLQLDGADDPRLPALPRRVRRRGDGAGADGVLRGRHRRPAGRPGGRRRLMHRLSVEQARRIAVRAQLLDAPRPTDLLDVVRPADPGPARPDRRGRPECRPAAVEPPRVVVRPR